MSKFNPDYIIFTDASLRRHGDLSYSAYGVVILNTRTKMYSSFSSSIWTSSIAYAEAFAIYKAIEAVKKMVNGNKVDVLVVSDSKFNIMVFTKYINKSWDTSDWDNWKKRDGKPVKNQDLYRKMVALFNSAKNIRLRMAHINSHVKIEDWKKIYKKLKGVVNVDRATVETFIKMNGLADKLATEVTYDMVNGKVYYKLEKRLEEV